MPIDLATGAPSPGGTPTMPPAGGPSGEERALLAEWLACGAPCPAGQVHEGSAKRVPPVALTGRE
jgi:hypothetical protein